MVNLSLDCPLRCLGIFVGQVAYLLHMITVDEIAHRSSPLGNGTVAET
jgi:hypothetical protein